MKMTLEMRTVRKQSLSFNCVLRTFIEAGPRRSSTVQVLALMGLVSGCGQVMAGTSTTPTLLPNTYLSTKGNQIVDQNGNPVRLACTGYFDPGGLNGASIQSDMAGMVAAGFNCLRYPWYDATLSANLAQADQIVAAASAVGLKVILDHHGDETPGSNNGWLPYPCNGLPFDLGPGSNGTDGCGDTGTVTEARFVQDWVTVAQHYAGNSTVIGFDLTNEPHLSPSYWSLNPGGSTWGNGSATDLRAIYQQAGNAIQSVNSGVLIIAECIINQTSKLLNGGTPVVVGMGDCTPVSNSPVTLNITNKVVYSIHDYPAPIGGVSPDSGPTKIQAMNTNWGYLITQNIAPMFIGEMGGSLDGTDDSAGTNLADERAWAATLVAYLNGQDGSQFGPTFSGKQQGISTDWWAWGDLAGEWPDGTRMPNGTLNSAQYAVYNQLWASPPTNCAVSANDSTVTSVGAVLCDSSGNMWAITNLGTITINGTAAGYSANVIELAYVNGVIWQENSSKLWWSWVGGTWTPTSGTSTSPLP
jgi:endoglucanase